MFAFYYIQNVSPESRTSAPKRLLVLAKDPSGPSAQSCVLGRGLVSCVLHEEQKTVSLLTVNKALLELHLCWSM